MNREKKKEDDDNNDVCNSSFAVTTKPLFFGVVFFCRCLFVFVIFFFIDVSILPELDVNKSLAKEEK